MPLTYTRDGTKGNLTKVLRQGMYLGSRPQPMDENLRLGSALYEIQKWGAGDLEDLDDATRKIRRQMSGQR